MERFDGYIKISQVGSCVGCAFNVNPGCNAECNGENYIFVPKLETPNYYEENGKKYIRVANGEPTNSWAPCSGCVFDTAGACTDQCEGRDYIFSEAPTKPPEIHEASHQHHAVWREYTESLLAGNPEQLEQRASTRNDWVNGHPHWRTDFEYRIKPEPKLFWYMNGEKIVEKGLDGDTTYSVNIRSFNRDYYKQFPTQYEADTVAQELIRILNTLEVK